MQEFFFPLIKKADIFFSRKTVHNVGLTEHELFSCFMVMKEVFQN